MKPARVRPRSTSRARPASSSIYTAVSASLVSYGGRGDLNDGEEQTELANGVGEAFVVHGLGNVDVATEFVAALDLVGIVRRGQHHHRRTLEILVFLDPLQNVDAGRVRQIEIEQDQERAALVVEARSILAKQVVQRGCTVGERDYLIVDTGSTDIPLDQAGVALIVLNHDDDYWITHVRVFRLPIGQLIGSVIVNVLPW